MRIIKMLSIAGLALAPVAAQAESAGVLSAPNGGVFVARNGAVIAGTSGMVLQSGDRVMTRAGSTARVSLGSCTTQVASASVLAVGGCATPARSFAAAQDDQRAGTATESSQALRGRFRAGGVIVGLLALVAIGFGIWAAADGDSSPNSP